jgi:hypothetical protein
MGLVRLLLAWVMAASRVLFETYQKDFLFYQQVLAQQPKDKNKIYSLHEPDVYVIEININFFLQMYLKLTYH